ncbi:hypothetical protein TeGR_g14206 [Tetraparma gracilis]|uniref:DNA-directed RNA polymerase III subunit n=1 Tax=Tetraparma gracilis TaxID=2962635 RepID=A0ABQ6MA20_9STRA|nr:hypothetical protein TeGR_g14206 [Tetraparma gracilis]
MTLLRRSAEETGQSYSELRSGLSAPPGALPLYPPLAVPAEGVRRVSRPDRQLIGVARTLARGILGRHMVKPKPAVADFVTYKHRSALQSDADSSWIHSKCMGGYQGTALGKHFPDELLVGQSTGKRRMRAEGDVGKVKESAAEKGERLRLLFQKEREERRAAGGGGAEEGEEEEEEEEEQDQFEKETDADYTKDHYASSDDDDDGEGDGEGVF